MDVVVRLILGSIAVMIAAYLVPGVSVASFGTAVLVALALGVLNALVKPVLLFLTLPINILTLGLFSLVINIVILYLASALVPGFEIANSLAALLFSIVLSIAMGLLFLLI